MIDTLAFILASFVLCCWVMPKSFGTWLGRIHRAYLREVNGYNEKDTSK